MDARADFGTAEVTIRARVRVFTLTPLSLERLPVEYVALEAPALASVPSISGHSISAVAPDHIFSTKGVSVRAFAA